MPGLDGSQEAALPEMADSHVARSRFRPRRRIAPGDLGAHPATVLAELVQVDTGEAGGEDFVAAITIPIDDVNPMDDAFIRAGDQFALPLARAVEDQQGMTWSSGRSTLAPVSG